MEKGYGVLSLAKPVNLKVTLESRILTFTAPNAALQRLILHSRAGCKMRKGWAEEKISFIVQNSFSPKETEVVAREVKRQDKKKEPK